ncbi:MAG: delta 1-pyrroline-5-carboxylate synthetase [Candidatus Bathyarchaeota archaeon]|nr:delta 1-pyrroline-5-carboxylate synthetase [Candidatus Bathyarchaeota archaeon]
MDIAVLKVGGSLAEYPLKLRLLAQKIGELSVNHRLVVVGGGGEFADVVRQLDGRFGLSDCASHRMAILGMDQYGLLLADIIPNAVVTGSIEETLDVLDKGGLPVFLPSTMLFRLDPLENSWDVTSDSIALYVAGRLGASRLLLLTDVDGVYTADPKVHADAELIGKLSADELSDFKQRTSVDRYLPKLIVQTQIDCYVVNGLYPERVAAVLQKQEGIYTKISGKTH